MDDDVHTGSTFNGVHSSARVTQPSAFTRTECYSPKVFKANSATVSAPALDILGKRGRALSNYTDNSLSDNAMTHRNAKLSMYENIPQMSMSVHAPKPVATVPEPMSLSYCDKSTKTNEVYRTFVTPSPFFNRNPSYKQFYKPVDERVTQFVGEKPFVPARNHTKPAGEKPYVPENTVDDIINMCTEYENQVHNARPPHTPNRIITNGSLPRDRAKHPDDNVFRFDAVRYNSHENVAHASGYENVVLLDNKPRYPQSPRTRIKTCITYSLKDNNESKVDRDVDRVDADRSGNFEVTDRKMNGRFLEGQVDRNADCSRNFGTNGAYVNGFSKGNANRDADCRENFETNDEKINERFSEENVDRDADCCENFGTNGSKINERVTERNVDRDVERVDRDADCSGNFAVIDGNINGRFSGRDANCTTNDLKTATENPVYNRQRQSSETKDKSKDKHYKTLLEHRDLIHAAILDVTRNINELEFHENELTRELELEKSLLTGEYECERKCLREIEEKRAQLAAKIDEIEMEMNASRAEQQREQDGIVERIKVAESEVARLENEMVSGHTHETKTQLESVNELIETQKKLLEDLEFHHLEQEANLLATREEIQREINELTKQAGLKAKRVMALEQQKLHANDLSVSESKQLEDALGERLKSLEDLRVRLRGICHELNVEYDHKLTKDLSDSDGMDDATDDVGGNLTDDVKLNGHVGVIERDEKRVGDELWEREQLSKSTTESEDSALVSTDSAIRNSYDVTENREKSGSDQELKHDSVFDSNDDYRPSSDASDLSYEMLTSPNHASLSHVASRARHMSQSPQQRPLTRYLPILNDRLDLRLHILSAGHPVDLCPHIFIDSSTCRGYLNKMGSRFHQWNKRWFVFDRNKRVFAYYADRSEKKVRGGVTFQRIEEVYLDHTNAVKSPNPNLTFIVKTNARNFHLMAPSPEAMRIWLDVVFTGAEAYQQFDR